MKNAGSVLVFRTVSVERIQGVLSACRENWPAARLYLLSSPNRRGELLNDPRVFDVFEIERGSNGFSKRIDLPIAFSAVVVPFGNGGGSGYANVLAVAIRCRALEWYVMPHTKELLRISRAKIRLRIVAEECLLGLSLPVGWMASLILAPRH